MKISKKSLDCIGKTFNRLTVLSAIPNLFYTICECGNTKYIKNTWVTKGIVKSCGCYNKEKITKHGFSRHYRDNKLKTYQIWSGIKQRCFNKNCKAYKRYGGAGITMSEEWKNDFEKFLNDMGERPFNDASIDRIDTTKGYFKENCRWATKLEQANNTKSNVNITFGTATRSLAYWCRFFGIHHATASSRIKEYGMTPHEALTTPSKHQKIKIGDVFGQLTVIEFGQFKNYKCSNKHQEIFCVCSCGKNYKTLDTRLKFGKSKRCQSCAAKVSRQKQLQNQRHKSTF